jgi:hypothetical protein
MRERARRRLPWKARRPTSLTGTFTVETGACAGVGGTFDLSR